MMVSAVMPQNHLHALPDGFGDERDDRMRRAQQTFQNGDQRIAGAAQFRPQNHRS